LPEYIPQPVDTSRIELPTELQDLMERIAQNNHEVWSEGRVHDGWRYGTVRDDQKKQHSCLVPYSELPETEKDYDRRTATEVLKLVIALGYKIQK
jgi:hypothetical protein